MPVGNKAICPDLKNAQYQAALISGHSDDIKDISCVGDILASETNRNRKEPWSRLNQTEKIQKLNEYADKISKEKHLSSTEITRLKEYFAVSLNKKRLQKVKDVVYDKENGAIKTIPNLNFNSAEKRFTLKRAGHRISTTKSLGMGRTRKRNSTDKGDKIDTMS